MYIKARCNNCKETISLFFDEHPDAEVNIPSCHKGEYIEQKCPLCNKWSAMEVLE